MMGLFDRFDEVPALPPKTPEQILQEAIRDYLGSRGHTDGVLMDWVIVTSQHVVNPQGGSATNLAFHTSEDMALHRVAGLIRYADIRIEELFRHGGS